MTVYKLLAKDTVEEYMLKCGEKKLQLEKDVVGNESIGGIVTVSFTRDWLFAKIYINLIIIHKKPEKPEKEHLYLLNY